MKKSINLIAQSEDDNLRVDVFVNTKPEIRIEIVFSLNSFF